METIAKPASTTVAQKILSIDIGGSNVKATLLNEEGELQTEYKKLETPVPATPEKVMAAIGTLAASLPGYDKISAGFPGYVKDNIVMTAPNLGTKYWKEYKLGDELTTSLGKPAIVVNDADMQGLGIAAGKGFEIVVTLGTGFGTAFLYNGVLLPHIELAHHPLSKDRDYDVYIGEKALIKEGDAKWNKRMRKVVTILKTVFNYDHLYIGGGNAKKLNFSLDKNISIVSNREGIKGGARLWK
ncbi:MAG: ROK family protein [Bacteroidota bacterium]